MIVSTLERERAKNVQFYFYIFIFFILFYVLFCFILLHLKVYELRKTDKSPATAPLPFFHTLDIAK